MLLNPSLKHSYFPLSPVFVPYFLLLSTLCDILCIFKRLIRVFSCVLLSCVVVVDVAVILVIRYLRKSFYQMRHFFVTRIDTMCATDARTLSITPRERRSWTNFRSRYVTQKNIFFAYILDLGLATDIYLYKNKKNM